MVGGAVVGAIGIAAVTGGVAVAAGGAAASATAAGATGTATTEICNAMLYAAAGAVAGFAIL